MITSRISRALPGMTLIVGMLSGPQVLAQQITLVSPDNGSLTVGANLTGRQAIFTVSSQSSQSTSRTLTILQCSGQVTSCSAPASTGNFIQSINITVTFTSLAGGTGTIVLQAQGSTSSDQGSINVTVTPAYGVAVTPDGGMEPTRTANTGGYSAAFTVKNTGSNGNTYTLTCSGTGGVTCGMVPGPLTFPANQPGSQQVVNMPYSVGAAGTGTLTLTATGSSGGVSDQGSFSVPIVSYGVAVTPDAQVTPTRFSGAGGYSETFWVQNTGSTSNTYTFACSSTGGIVCGTPPAALPLANGVQAQVSMPYTTGVAGTGTLTLTATGTNASDPGSYTIPVAVTLSRVSGGALTLDGNYLLQATADGYDAGRVTRVTDARSYITDYQYGGNGSNAFLVQVKRWKIGSSGDYLATDIAYDTSGYVSSIRDEGGTFRYFIYDLYGRLRQIKNHGSTVVRAYGYTFSRTSGNSWAYQATSPNAVVESTFVQHTPSLQVLVTTGYIDGLGRSIQSVVKDGTNYHVSATEYDLLGRTWRVWKPYTRTTAGYDAGFATNATTFYNAYHSPWTTVPYVETLYRPDPIGRVKQVTPEYLVGSPSAVVAHGYDIDAVNKLQITQITDESIKKTRTFTDVFGNTMRSILGSGAPESTVTQFSYNVVGQRLQTTDPRNLNINYVFNTRGLVTSRTSPDAGTVNTKFDKGGNVRFTQDANQVAAGKVAYVNYDFSNRPLVSGLGTATFASLNADVSEAFEAAEANWLVVRAYDAKPTTGLPWNRFTAHITPLDLSNVGGRLAAVGSLSNGAWQVTLFSYDADGQVKGRHTFTEANGGSSVLTALNLADTLFRDLRGALTERRLSVGANRFYHWYEYDTRGLLTKLFASPTSTKPPTADVTDTYLPGGRAKDYRFNGGPTVPIRYTIRGQTERIAWPTQTECPTCPFAARIVYLPNGVVDTVMFWNAASPVAPQQYRYGFGTSGYDALNRIKGADFSGWSGSSWTTTLAHDLTNISYDASGNLLTLRRYRETPTLVDDLTYTVAPSSNRLTQIADVVDGSPEQWDAEDGGFSYDANGNLLTAPAPYSITAVSYNHQNLALSITSSGVTSNYRYDDVGR